MDLHLRDKAIVITGGAKGIGEAICHTLIEEGAIPIVLDKDEKAGKKLIADAKQRVVFIPVDLTSANACLQAVEQIAKSFQEIYGLVNNAGRNDGIGLEHGTPQKFIDSLTNNAGHYYYLANALLPLMKNHGGAIVNISSKTALTGQGSTSGYIAAKGAILSLTREWAVELLKYNIRVNAVVPAEVWTPLYESWVKNFPDPEKKVKEIAAKIPLEKRMTTPREIADAVVFLLSDRASHITGQWIHVDGGYVHLDRALT